MSTIFHLLSNNFTLIISTTNVFIKVKVKVEANILLLYIYIAFINTYCLVSSSSTISNASFLLSTCNSISSNLLTILKPLIDYLIKTLYIDIKIYI